MDIAKLDKYVQPRKQSVLTPYLDEIRYLVERGATQKSILAYLKNEEGIEVTQSYLSRFIKRYITTSDTTPKSEPSREELSKDSEPTQNATSSKKEELDNDTLASMEEYMKNMSHIFEAKKRRQ